MRSDKPNQQPTLGTIEGAQIAAFDPEMPVQSDNPQVEQSQDVTEDVGVNEGVGPQPDEHRGNAQGGFKYEGSKAKEG